MLGANGRTGATGAQGPSGPSGPSGGIGVSGAGGPTGPSGATGGTGPKGNTGTKGASGPTGPTGVSWAALALESAGSPGIDAEIGPLGLAATYTFASARGTGAYIVRGQFYLPGPTGATSNSIETVSCAMYSFGADGNNHIFPMDPQLDNQRVSVPNFIVVTGYVTVVTPGQVVTLACDWDTASTPSNLAFTVEQVQ